MCKYGGSNEVLVFKRNQKNIFGLRGIMNPNHHCLRVKSPPKNAITTVSPFPLKNARVSLCMPAQTQTSVREAPQNQKREFLPVKISILLHPNPTPYPRQPMRKRHPRMYLPRKKGWRGSSKGDGREQIRGRSCGGVWTQRDQQAGGLLPTCYPTSVQCCKERAADGMVCSRART